MQCKTIRLRCDSGSHKRHLLNNCVTLYYDLNTAYMYHGENTKSIEMYARRT